MAKPPIHSNELMYYVYSTEHTLSYSLFSEKNDVNSEITIPLLLFTSSQDSSLRLITRYLKDIKGLRYSTIGKLLNRDERTIWGAYNSGAVVSAVDSKQYTRFRESYGAIEIPLSIFEDRTYSVLESVVRFLKHHKGMSYGAIASALNKKYTTIHTTYKRSLQK